MNIALMSHDNKKDLMVQFCTAYAGILSQHFGTRANARFVVPPKFKAWQGLLWPPGTGRVPWAFPPPLRRCPSFRPNRALSAAHPSLEIGF